MDTEARKTALRMIPYGLYILSAENQQGQIAAATVSWVTQTSFEPPLVAVAMKVDSQICRIAREAGAFTLNILGKDQRDLATAFFKPAQREGDTIGGEPFRTGATGAPILERTPGFIECKVTAVLDPGDHSIFVGEVVDAGMAQPVEGRPDSATLWLRDLGEKIFYGG